MINRISVGFVSALLSWGLVAWAQVGGPGEVKEKRGYVHLDLVKKRVTIDTVLVPPARATPARVFYLDSLTIAATASGAVYVATNRAHTAPLRSVFLPNAYRGRYYTTSCFVRRGPRLFFVNIIRGTNNAQLVEVRLDNYVSRVLDSGYTTGCPTLAADGRTLSYFFSGSNHDYRLE